jgi:hypothetical protein
MKNLFVVRHWLLIVSWLAVFAAGIEAQRFTSQVSMHGQVMDANTITELIQYWEVRSATGESIVIMGRGDLPLIHWLRQSKNRHVVVSIDLAPDDDSR